MTLPDTVERIMDKYRIPHYAIEVELTETTSDVEFSDIRRVVSSFHEKGINTSIDDFGMGFSSLNILRDIPWSTVKIDKSFLPDSCEGSEMSSSNIMFSLVVSMTRQLGLECICEGVETQAHIELLKRYGCDLAQGYFFDKPIPVEEFEQRLEKGKYDI